MGASQSGQKRTVTLQNPHPEGVISVSDDVVRRIRGSARERAAEQQQKQNKSDVKHDVPPQVPPSATANKSTTSTTATAPVTSGLTDSSNKANVPSSIPSTYGNPLPYPPPGIVLVEPTITSIDVRRQKDAELVQNDLYWQKRMNQLEQTLNKTNSIMEKEYSAAVQDVRKSFENAPPIHQLPACQDIKAQLIACYRAHPGESLKCTEEVNAFINCVSQSRVKKIDHVNDDDTKTKSSSVSAANVKN